MEFLLNQALLEKNTIIIINFDKMKYRKFTMNSPFINPRINFIRAFNLRYHPNRDNTPDNIRKIIDDQNFIYERALIKILN